MDPITMASLGKAGAAAAIAMAAVGSAIGTGSAGLAAIGAWKKCYLHEKSAPFLLFIFIGAPLSQTIYGMILMNFIARICDVAAYLPAEVIATAREAAATSGQAWLSHVPAAELDTAREALAVGVAHWPAMLVAGLLGGIAMAFSAMWQGRAGAAGADAMAETGQGFGNYLMTIGIVETVALFVLVFIQAALT